MIIDFQKFYAQYFVLDKQQLLLDDAIKKYRAANEDFQFIHGQDGVLAEQDKDQGQKDLLKGAELKATALHKTVELQTDERDKARAALLQLQAPPPNDAAKIDKLRKAIEHAKDTLPQIWQGHSFRFVLDAWTAIRDATEKQDSFNTKLFALSRGDLTQLDLHMHHIESRG